MVRRTTALAPALAAALLLAGASLPAVEVNVYLTSGEVVRGEIISQDDAAIHLKRSLLLSSGIVSGVVVYDRSLVDKVVDAPDPLIEFTARRNRIGDTALEHAQLSRWCRSMALPDQALAQALLAIQCDPASAPALTELHALGYLLADGVWQAEKPYLQRTGQVRYNGVIMTKAAAEAMQAQGQQQQGRQAEQTRLANLRRQSAALTLQQTSASTRLAAIALAQRSLEKRLAEDQVVLAHFQDLNDAYTRAQNQPAAQSGGSPGHMGAGAGWGGNTGANTGGPDASDLVRLGDVLQALKPKATQATDDSQAARHDQAALLREARDLTTKLASLSLQLAQLQAALSAPGTAAPGAPAAPVTPAAMNPTPLPPALTVPPAPAPVH